jgi:hypothetical protein
MLRVPEKGFRVSLFSMPAGVSRSTFLVGAAALAGCGGGLVSAGKAPLSGGSRAVRSASQSMADYTVYTTSPNGFKLMQSTDGSTMAYFDPQGGYLFSTQVTSVDDTYMYVTTQNNASRFTSLTVNQAIPYNLVAHTTYYPDPATALSYAPDPSTGNTVVTATNNVGSTTVTAVSSTETDYSDTQGLSSQRVNVGMGLSSSSNGQTCGGHVCAYSAPAPARTPRHGRHAQAVRHTESTTMSCIASAGGTATAMLNVAGKFFKVAMTSGGIVVELVPEIDLLALAAGAIALGIGVSASYLSCYAQNQATPK